MWTYCGNIVKILWKYCGNIVKILWKMTTFFLQVRVKMKTCTTTFWHLPEKWWRRWWQRDEKQWGLASCRNWESSMVYTVLKIPEWAFHERVRTHCVQRYMFAFARKLMSNNKIHRTNDWNKFLLRGCEPLNRCEPEKVPTTPRTDGPTCAKQHFKRNQDG